MDGERQDYLVDFLGSITGSSVPDGSGSSYIRYKPYGSTYAGSGFSQLFGWTGNSGSQALGLDYVCQYNLARVYSSKAKQWTTRDPLWPEENAYGYVNGNPVTWIDPSGQNPAQQFWDCMAELDGQGGMTKRQRCHICKAQSGSSIRCDSPCFDPQKGDPEDCSQRRPGCDRWESPCAECHDKCRLNCGTWPTDDNCRYWEW